MGLSLPRFFDDKRGAVRLFSVQFFQRAASVQSFRVVSEMDLEPAATLTPFVGRASELATLGRVLDELLAVWLGADAGDPVLPARRPPSPAVSALPVPLAPSSAAEMPLEHRRSKVEG